MKGVSNIVTFVFLFSLFLIGFYISVSTLLTSFGNVMEDYKSMMDFSEKRELIKYSELKYDVNSQKIEMDYNGSIPEYCVRLICVRADYNSFCVLPISDTNQYSASMIEPTILNTVYFDLSECGSEFLDECNITGSYCDIICYIAGRVKIVPKKVRKI